MHFSCAIQIQSNFNHNEVPLTLPQLSRTRPTSISHRIQKRNHLSLCAQTVVPSGLCYGTRHGGLICLKRIWGFSQSTQRALFLLPPGHPEILARPGGGRLSSRRGGVFEDQNFLDESLTGNPNLNDHDYTEKIYSKSQPRMYEFIQDWRSGGREPRQSFVIVEAYANLTIAMKYYSYGSHFPLNFGIISYTNRNSTAADFKTVIDTWMQTMPVGATANWVASRAREISLNL